ncbi:MAG: FecR family protein [Porticoccaceae bacterium]
MIYEGDLIETDARARIRMSFTDGGTYVLRDQTTFEIDEYSFSGQEDGTEQASFSLIQGALEALSGLIGRNNNQNFRLDTPLATIGLRGTEFTINVLPPATPGGLPTVQLSVLGGTVVYQSTISAPGAPPSPVIAVEQGNSVEQVGDSTPLQINRVISPMLTITVEGEDVNEVIEQLFDAEINEEGNEVDPADMNAQDEEEAREEASESTVPAEQIDDLVESLSGVLSEEALVESCPEAD